MQMLHYFVYCAVLKLQLVSTLLVYLDGGTYPGLCSFNAAYLPFLRRFRTLAIATGPHVGYNPTRASTKRTYISRLEL